MSGQLGFGDGWISDADLEAAINDRVSFRKFPGLSLEAPSPDHSTLCRFRNQLSRRV